VTSFIVKLRFTLPFRDSEALRVDVVLRGLKQVEDALAQKDPFPAPNLRGSSLLNPCNEQDQFKTGLRPVS